MVRDFIKAVAEERDGFIVDEPWRLSDESLSVIVPILRKSKKKREYITFSEANDVKVEDTGQIDSVYVKNNEEKPLYVGRGDIFRGKTQERASVHGCIIMPGKGKRVDVRCIHQSKGIQSGADMKYGGRTPSVVNFQSQARTWETVNVYSCSVQNRMSKSTTDEVFAQNMEAPVREARDEVDELIDEGGLNDSVQVNFVQASDNLVNTLDNLSDSIKKAMKKIPEIKNQVGVVFVNDNDVLGLDVYDLPDSWKSVKTDVVEKEGSNFIKKEDASMFEFKPDKCKKFIGKKLGGKFEEKVIYDDKTFKVVELKEVTDDKKGKKLVGEASIFKGNVIHLTMYKD